MAWAIEDIKRVQEQRLFSFIHLGLEGLHQPTDIFPADVHVFLLHDFGKLGHLRTYFGIAEQLQLVHQRRGFVGVLHFAGNDQLDALELVVNVLVATDGLEECSKSGSTFGGRVFRRTQNLGAAERSGEGGSAEVNGTSGGFACKSLKHLGFWRCSVNSLYLTRQTGAKREWVSSLRAQSVTAWQLYD